MTQWTPEIVAERLVAAARTLRASETVARAPAGLRSGMPDFVRERSEAYGYTEATQGRAHPAAAALRALDEVSGWIATYLHHGAAAVAGLPADAGKIAWARAAAAPWPRIAEMRVALWKPTAPPGGNSRESLRQIVVATHRHLAACLNRARVPLHVGSAHEPDGPVQLATGDSHAMPRQMDGRPMVLNEFTCGLCARIQADSKTGGWRCGRGLGAVSAVLRARHPKGEECFEARPPA